MTVPRQDRGDPPQLTAASHSNQTTAVRNSGSPSALDAQSTVASQDDSIPSQRTRKLWSDVAHGIDNNSTVVWKSAVNSLADGLKFLQTSNDARAFVEGYMRQIISILLEQVPQKIGSLEKSCVQESLMKALLIVLEELKLKGTNLAAGDCVVVDVLGLLFNKKMPYYKGSKHSWNNALSGMPEIRMQLIDKFRSSRGFAHLGSYLQARTATQRFPPLDTIRLILEAARDAVPQDVVTTPAQMKVKKSYEDDIICVANAVMGDLGNQSEDALKKLHHDDMSTIRWGLQAIFQLLILSRRSETYKFYAFCRDFALKLITSQSLPLKLYGWENVNELVEISASMAPPPKTYIASGAGVTFVNGEFQYAAAIGEDGFVSSKTDYCYECIVPPASKDDKSKKLTLFKCTMRSQQKWWFISEADEHQPGTDKDIDYYQQKSKKNEETYPPSTGWMTCKSAGIDPPPFLEGKGVVVPVGEEFNTMEHQLAQWAIDNKVVELVLGNSIHREIVARSVRLICFLASMCTKDEPVEHVPAGKTMIPNAYCLNSSHLELAWKTCESKLDAAVSAEVYQLLVSILPSLPNELIVELFKTIRNSCKDSLFEVAEFCSAYATSGEIEGTIYFSDEVRKVLLKLLWSVLTHPDASTLKCIDDVKNFMSQELRAQRIGHVQRQNFLNSCKQSLTQNAKKENCNEASALRIVGLTRFILEACPRGQAAAAITENKRELAFLLFNDLIAYMKRRGSKESTTSIKKASSNLTVADEFQHSYALEERLDVLRFVYGLSGTVEMTCGQLDTLWRMCTDGEDLEAVMSFLANASSNETPSTQAQGIGSSDDKSVVGPVHIALTAAFSDDVTLYTFHKLFCSHEVRWENLGTKAYQSFQLLLRNSRDASKTSSLASGPALDALWRICLAAGDDEVANHAMRDLLHVYSQMSQMLNQNEAAAQNAWSKKNVVQIEDQKGESFAQKIFDCLKEVKVNLQKCDELSMRSAERCVRILNAAVGQSAGSESQSASCSPLVHSKIRSTKSIDGLVDIVPHGCRGQRCYKMISVVAKRAGGHQSSQSRRLPQTERFSIQIHPFETLSSLKRKVSTACRHQLHLVKPITLDGKRNLNVEVESTFLGDLNISEGSEIVFLLAANPFPENKNSNNSRSGDQKSGLSFAEIFGGSGQGPTDEFFNALLDVLEALALARDSRTLGTHKLVWDLLQSVPSNKNVVERVRSAAQTVFCELNAGNGDEKEPMTVDVKKREGDWSQLLDRNHYQKSVYVLQVIDSFLQPAFEVLHQEGGKELQSLLLKDSESFRQGFVESGGYDAVCQFFTSQKSCNSNEYSRFRMENTSVLRILKACFYGKSSASILIYGKAITQPKLDNTGQVLMKSLHNVEPLLTNLTASVVLDSQLPPISVMDVVILVRSILTFDPAKVPIFSSIPNGISEMMTIDLLKWDNKEAINTTATSLSSRIRKSGQDFILDTPNLSHFALPWLINAIDNIDTSSDCTSEFFAVIIRLVELINSGGLSSSRHQLTMLSDSVFKKLASYSGDKVDSRPDDEFANNGVLCGCLEIISALINGEVLSILGNGVQVLLDSFGSSPWSSTQKVNKDSSPMIDLMGVIFEVFLTDGKSASSSAVCSDKKSRKIGFDVLNASAMACKDDGGYSALASRIQNIISAASPSLQHKWGQHSIGLEENCTLGNTAITPKYSGLRNQGCTCYMNSVLQQLFMMPALREKLSSATIPSQLRSEGGTAKAQGKDLVGKQISLQWENGTCYEAEVLSFSEDTGMHIIRYRLLRLPSENTNTHTESESSCSNVSVLPQEFPDEFILSEGRPGKETGLFEMQQSRKGQPGGDNDVNLEFLDIEETVEQGEYRRLLQEFQRTLVHLDEGSRGRVFDPRSLVEASSCLKLEFDIWQQNDASEFAMKLLDKLEVPLKRWSPNEFKFLEHTFRLKQTKQKLCKECGLKTNREENLMNIDCQIRGNSNIHEALSTMCEVEYMEGDNKVFCDNCKKNTDTVLRTAISALPDMLVLSLKRFDLDFNTFETVKLNSRCEFGQTLNMKKYTLEGVEAMEKSNESMEMMDDPLAELPDDDYEYKLAGVLVHHGVAQGGHYYSFIRDRTECGLDTNQWYRFDDEDVTPFDPANIESECFGGKVKKETKWPNGQVNTVETEQMCNALMIFYEKVKPAKLPNDDEGSDRDTKMNDPDDKVDNKEQITLVTGSDEYQADVQRSNTVHRSHSFLFGIEFQAFIKKLLKFSTSVDIVDTKNEDSKGWKRAILDISISYFFDVLLHSVEKNEVDEWTALLHKALQKSPHGSRVFLHDLARRSKLVAGNWLRTYASDCPKAYSRVAAMEVIASAIAPTLSIQEEVTALECWTTSWLEQTRDWENSDSLQGTPIPLSLHGKHRTLENPSCLGSIITFLNLLLELGPRTWRYNSDLCLLLREIACIPSEAGGDTIRNALNAAQVPPRLICLILREKSHTILRRAFPGASLSADVVEAISKVESNPNAHLLPLSSTVNAFVGPSTGSPSPADHTIAIEALASSIGISGARSAALSYEVATYGKARPSFDLTDHAKNVLSIVFNECSSQQGSSRVMTKKDMMKYMNICNISQQRITNVLNKYGKDSDHLAVEGFLAHYRDISQSSEVQVFNDLHEFGFRPDLSRCTLDARVFKNVDNIARFNKVERVVNDVNAMMNAHKRLSISTLTKAGLATLSLYHTASYSSFHLAEYLFAFTSLLYRDDIHTIMLDALRALYHAQGAWSGNDVAQVIQMALKTLAAIPDDKQKERITAIMQCNEKVEPRKDVGCGLLSVAKELCMSRNSHHYNADYPHDSASLELYVDTIKELRKLRAVEDWLLENKSHWDWLERWLRGDPGRGSDRSDLNRRDGIVNHSRGAYDNHSDSDLNGDINASDEDDEDDDSRFDGFSPVGTSGGILAVRGAGANQVNGIYTCTSKFDGVDLYTKNGNWQGNQVTFTLFRCRLSDNTKRWYISIIPENNTPGTSKDMDFYMAPARCGMPEIPHEYQWTTNKAYGIDPPPVVEWKQTDVSLTSDDNEDPVHGDNMEEHGQ